MEILQSETDCYDVIEILGKGTFGEVAKSWKRGTGEMVAIKILKNDAYRSRIIKNELKLLKAMQGVDPEESHIVQFYEFFHDESKFYLVFELLEENLFEYQKENNFSPLPIRHIRTITTQVLKALSKLKELSIIHADLKPENIMIVNQAKFPFRVKVIDFGSASIFNEVRFVKEPYIQSRFYRSPEILLGLPFCEKVDMWSLGCVMAELQLGWPLYPGSNEYDQIRYICETQGMPKTQLLNAASKTHHFFKRNPHPQLVHQWQLKSLAEYQAETKVKPLERRKYILKCLDQIEFVNNSRSVFPDNEVLAEYYDLKNMVELIKRMLTWDSHERINPNAAMKHPFISMQQLKMNYEPTKYYQLSLQCIHDCIRDNRILEGAQYYNIMGESYYNQEEQDHFRDEKGQAIPTVISVQRTIDQMDDLTIEEPMKEVSMNLWGEGTMVRGHQPSTSMENASVYPDHAYLHIPSYQANRSLQEHWREPILVYYGNRYGTKQRKVPRPFKSDTTFVNLIPLRQHSPQDAISWEDEESGSLSNTTSSIQESSGTEEQMVFQKPHPSTVERAQTEPCESETYRSSDWPSGSEWTTDGKKREGPPPRVTTHHGPNQHQHYLHTASQH
ncbi:homeodomain-interacting protein kinase 4 [Rhinatrema bivittatum]|uniref:homeodomain-interacting protein kinase 4 n=1 Tax=Rhinatrema bivittatum TaxID=194408 RepID=UPI001126FA48|nr:homeodomain-interacting protein kinase 4 [Rhinatrema bivittatum]